jgi:hypothetical protein
MAVFGDEVEVEDGEGPQDTRNTSAGLAPFHLVHPKTADSGAFGQVRLIKSKGSPSCTDQLAHVGHGSERGSCHVSYSFLLEM